MIHSVVCIIGCVYRKPHPHCLGQGIAKSCRIMVGLVCFIWSVLIAQLKSRSRLAAENAVLRHQVAVLRRQIRGRVRLNNFDRTLLVQLYRGYRSILRVFGVVRPETVIRWHRYGFRSYWRWKSRGRGGRPPINGELRALIRRMSRENRLWGAPRIQVELLKLGFSVAQSIVAKYMAKNDDPPSQSWSTVLCNHAPQIAAMDLFVVPTISFVPLYVLVIV